MPMSNLNPLQPINRLLDENQDRLGRFYKPLYMLSGAITFLILFALMVGLPLSLLDKPEHIVFAQALMVAAFFMLSRTESKDVFVRFAFSGVLFVVLSAGPVLLFYCWGNAYQALEAAQPSLLVPIHEVFLSAMIRGLATTGWTIPLLFYFFTFYPSFKDDAEHRQRALRTACTAGLLLHASAVSILIWRGAVFARSLADTAGADGFVKQAIEANQTGYLVFSLLCLGCGFVSLGLCWVLSRGEDSRLLLLTVVGLVAAQVCYCIGDWNGIELHSRYPAARAAGSEIAVFEEISTGDVVFVSSFYRRITRPATGELVVYSRCLAPRSGRFELAVFYRESREGTRFADQYRPVDLGLIETTQRDKLFCQPAE